MAITIADYSYRQKITGNAPASSLGGFAVLITEANVDSTFWDNVDNGGGDVRVSINEDGTSQLPLEIVLCNTATDKLIAWVRFPTYSTSARELYLFSGNSGQSKAGETTTYGRNNVWQDYVYVLHNALDDSAGNISAPTVTGTATSVVGPFGNSGGGRSYDGGSNYLTGNFTGYNNVFTLQSTSTVGSDRIHCLGKTGSSSDQINLRSVNSSNRDKLSFDVDGDDASDTATSMSSTEYNYLVARQVGLSERNIYANDGAVSASNTATVSTTGQSVFRVNASADSSPFNNGDISSYSEIKLRLDVLSDNFLASEYSNQDDPANFWAQSTPDDPSGGGGGITADGAITLPSLVFAGSATDTTSEVTAAGDITLPSLVFAGSATDSTSEITAAGDITLPSLVFAGSATDSTSEITAAGDITLPSLVFAGSATDSTSEITAAGDITLPSLVFAGSASTSEVGQVTAAGDITLPSLVFAGSATDSTSEITAAGDITLPSLLFQGNASDSTSKITATGAITLPSLVFAGSATDTETTEVTASGAITLPSLVFQGSATDSTSEVTVSGAITLPSLVFAGNATAGQVISDFTIQIDNTAKIIETTPNSFTIRI